MASLASGPEDLRPSTASPFSPGARRRRGTRRTDRPPRSGFEPRTRVRRWQSHVQFPRRPTAQCLARSVLVVAHGMFHRSFGVNWWQPLAPAGAVGEHAVVSHEMADSRSISRRPAATAADSTIRCSPPSTQVTEVTTALAVSGWGVDQTPSAVLVKPPGGGFSLRARHDPCSFCPMKEMDAADGEWEPVWLTSKTKTRSPLPTADCAASEWGRSFEVVDGLAEGCSQESGRDDVRGADLATNAFAGGGFRSCRRPRLRGRRRVSSRTRLLRWESELEPASQNASAQG